MSIDDSMHKIVKKNVRRPYVAENGKLLGRVTQTSVFENLFGSMQTLLSVTY